MMGLWWSENGRHCVLCSLTKSALNVTNTTVGNYSEILVMELDGNDGLVRKVIVDTNVFLLDESSNTETLLRLGFL